MSKTTTFSVSTGYVGSKKVETFTLEELGIDENLQGEEMEKALNGAFQEWLWDNIDFTYFINKD